MQSVLEDETVTKPMVKGTLDTNVSLEADGTTDCCVISISKSTTQVRYGKLGAHCWTCVSV